MGCKICKPKMMDCLSCPKNDNPKEMYCFDKEDCSVPFAMVRDGKIIGWERNNSITSTPNNMTEIELRELVRKRMQEELKPIVSEATTVLVDIITKTFDKGFNLGVEVGQMLGKTQSL